MNLLEQIRHLAETPYDGFIFSPHPEKEYHTHIESFCYVDAGQNVGEAEFGKRYEIVFLERDDEEEELYIEDRFNAILSDPIVYMHNLIKSGFYGVIGRKTTTSDKFFDSLFEE